MALDTLALPFMVVELKKGSLAILIDFLLVRRDPKDCVFFVLLRTELSFKYVGYDQLTSVGLLCPVQ